MHRPNILIVMVDQLTGTLFPDGPAAVLHTPNRARLADPEMRFNLDDDPGERMNRATAPAATAPLAAGGDHRLGRDGQPRYPPETAAPPPSETAFRPATKVMNRPPCRPGTARAGCAR
jgi:arylsulfatase A-like enzyme